MSALLKQKPNSSRKFNNCKFSLEGSKKFQKWHSTKVGCLKILNVINIKVPEFIKYHLKNLLKIQITYYLSKVLKQRKKKVLVISNFYMQMHQSGGQKTVAFRQISPYVSIIQPFQILIGRFQNLLNKALKKSWMLGYFKCSK